MGKPVQIDGDHFVTLQGRRWLVCSHGGPDCFRVLADLGWMAIDALKVRVQIDHSHRLNQCRHCGC